MNLIDEFMERYYREYDYYRESARICAEKCELELEKNGIRAIVTHRAKRPDRLKLKLDKRITEKDYKSIKDIYEDIVDFSGVRIALYFPSDRDEVDKVIKSNFAIHKVKKFPEVGQKNNYSKRFSGYWATHYRGTLKNEKLPEEYLRYTNCMVEIQVASVLMHAWSEVEHDLIYKPLSGKLSEDEYELLDQLNGLVMSGEIALERIQKAVKARVGEIDKQFNNHYEFSEYVYDTLRKNNDKLADKESLIVGRTDILFRFLQLANLDKPEQINHFLVNIDSDTEKRTVTEQIVDEILIVQPELFNKYNQAKHEVGQKNPYSDSQQKEIKPIEQTIGFFMTRWIVFESIIRKIYNKLYPNERKHASILFYLKTIKFLDYKEIYQIQQMAHMKNLLVHEFEYPKDIDLISTGNELVELIKKLHSVVNDDLKAIIDEEIVGIDL